MDAATTKCNVVLDLVKQGAEVIQDLKIPRYCFGCVCGSRWDLLSLLMNNMKACLGTSAFPYVVTCSASDEQSPSMIPGYMVVVNTCDGEVVPLGARINRCRALAYEGLRLRCTSRACPLRGIEVSADATADVLEDIHKHDLETDDITMDVDEDDEEGTDAGDAGGLAPQHEDTASKPYVVDVFTYGRPINYYEEMLSQIFRCESASYFLLLTRTGHPGALIAARSKSLEVIGLLDGVNKHSFNHGKQLMGKILVKRHWKEAEQTTTQSVVKRVRATDMSFIVATAPPPEEQTFSVMELEADRSGSGWRAGINNVIEDLATQMQCLLGHELETYGLCIMKTEFGRGLACRRAFREGEVICPASLLLYSSLSKLQEMLSMGGNKVLVDRLVRIDSLAAPSSESGAMSMYGALVGASGYIQHHTGLRRGGSNAFLKVNTEAGPNDGLLTVVSRTRNNQGIAAKSLI